MLEGGNLWLDELRLNERLLVAGGNLDAAFVLLVDLVHEGSTLSVPSAPLYAAIATTAAGADEQSDGLDDNGGDKGDVEVVGNDNWYEA